MAEKIYTKENLGYVDGYDEYTKKSGAHWGPGVQEKKKIQKNGYDGDKRDGVRLNWLYDKQSNRFKKIIKGYSFNTKTKSDEYEDPTYLIFDVEIDTDNSPLFNPKYGKEDFTMNRFLMGYWDNIPEIKERIAATDDGFGMYDEFRKQFLKIFPITTPESSDYPDSGKKQHYIESITGLDLLNKKIVNYPEDMISFTLSDDVTMLTQYIAELYNNVMYSYDTQRQLIPDNLLRFNIRILVSDVRNMKIKFEDTNSTSTEEYKDVINKNVSKMIYILHDCQLQFFETKSFGDEIIRGGFGQARVSTPAKNSFKISYKSVSKIMAPLLIDNSTLIDLRERDPLNKENYKTKYNNGVSDDVIIMKDGTKKRKFMDKVKGAIKNQASAVRNIIVNQLKNEVSDLTSKVNDWVVSKVGFSAIKLNVYQDTPGQKLGQINVKITNYVDKKVGNFLGTNDKPATQLKEREGNVYSSPSVALSSAVRKKNNEKIKDDVYGNWHEKGGVHYPSYNEKYPEGDVFPTGTYNEKYPDQDGNVSDVFPNGTYNEKYPKGDVSLDGKYHDKEPKGTVQPHGGYNEKFPEGDVSPNGTYNEKYPNGDVFPNGIYNEKYPSGVVEPKGTYNEKYPNGDVFPNGTYNEKHPNGTIQPQGGYNEKYPQGDVSPNGTYNEKQPKEEDIMVKGAYNQKYPKGNIYKK